MTKREMLDKIREKFVTGLQNKTGWGRNEVLYIYDDCVHAVIMESLEEDKK